MDEQAQKTALVWLKIVLDDQQNQEEIWDNHLEGAYEEPPLTKEAFDVLLPKVYQALRDGQPLPEMEYETSAAIKQYMEDEWDTIWASEYENNKEKEWVDDWTDAVQTAWEALYQRLKS